MERLVNRRLREQLEADGRLDHRQHAFRAGFGTNTYFTHLGEVLHKAYTEGLHTEVVSLDLSKAFNRTWTPIVLQQLVNWGLSGHIVHFIKNFLCKRSFRVAVGDTTSKPFYEETGVPQGSVIAVTLFLIAMNGVFVNLPKNIYIFVYADDILLIASGRSPVRTRIKTQSAVNAVVKWASSVGFIFSATKSVRCHICNSNHRIPSTPIVIGGTPIPTKKSVKIIGVRIDRKLTFKQHFDDVKTSCRTRLNLIRTISQPHRSNNRRTRFRVAQAIIDSRLFYGLELTCIASHRLIEMLSPIYHGYIRTISGLLPSTPADSACAEAGLLPFRHRLSEEICTKAAAFAGKTTGNQRIFLLAEGDRILRTVANIGLPPVARIHWNGDRSWQATELRIDNKIKDHFRAGDNSIRLRATVLDWLRTNYPNHQHRYTDGSLSSHGVGIGVSDRQVSISLSLSPLCSVFSAEAAAVRIAVTRPANRPILVLTDSASVVSALQADSPTHPWIQDIIRSTPANVTFAWIPGHCGIPGNTTADMLAGSGYNAARFTKSVPLDDMKRWLKKTFRQYWETEWYQSIGSHLRRIKETTDAWPELRTQRDQRIISRLRTGHTRLSHNMNSSPFHQVCSTCNTRNSVEHFLRICPLYDVARQTSGLDGCIDDLLDNNTTILATVIHFLKEAGLYNQI